VTVLGNGGELGIALEFPMRYLMNSPVVKVNGVETENYELIPGSFAYNSGAYSSTNATLVIYNAPTGSNTVELEFEGGRLGNVVSHGGEVTMWDALAILDYGVGNYNDDEFLNFGAYDYPDTTRDGGVDLWDALNILDLGAGNVDEYYNPK